MPKSDVVALAITIIIISAQVWAGKWVIFPDSARDIEPIPPLTILPKDYPTYYRNQRCIQRAEGSDAISCSLGDDHSEKIAILVGDSHANQWVPALDSIASNAGWKLIVFAKSSCPFARVKTKLRGKENVDCSLWREKALKRIQSLNPRILLASQSFRYETIGDSSMVAGLHDIWSEIAANGTRIVVISDTPWFGKLPGECRNLAQCRTPRKDATNSNALTTAASTFPVTVQIDMTDLICGPEYCDAVVGNIIAWRDSNHLSATYVKALTPYLEAAMHAAGVMRKAPRNWSVN